MPANAPRWMGNDMACVGGGTLVAHSDQQPRHISIRDALSTSEQNVKSDCHCSYPQAEERKPYYS